MADISTPIELKVRELQCKIILQSGEFKQGFNTKIINNNTINANVTKSLNNNFTNSADITIFGMNSSDIAALSTLGYVPLNYNFNIIELYAQYQGDVASLCFRGYIVKAWADYSDPSRPMHFQCQTCYQNAINNSPSLNIKGQISIVDLYKSLSENLGYSFENNGVIGIIENPILTGSYIQQLMSLSKQTNTNCVIDNNKVKISPIGYGLSQKVLLISSKSGLISYPSVDAWGVKFRMRYNPTLSLGQYIKLQTITPQKEVNQTSQSIVPKTDGKWYVYDMHSVLSNRHESWYTDVKCSYNNLDLS